ncbi:MAG: hypothetical protein GX286_07565 [Clostridiales bacterium]|nr:hypothetical protein [Clostridiales bacterium]
MRRDKGIKIYKSKPKRRGRSRSKFRRILSAVLTIVIAFGLGFLGYSVGEPILKYIKNKDKYSSGTSEFIPPIAETSESNNSENSDMSDSSSDESKQSIVNKKGNFFGYVLSVDDLSSKSKLSNALLEIKSNTSATSVVVPLKSSGGYINYATGIEDAGTAGAVKSTLTLDEIISEVKANGLKPVAEISTLADNIYPKMYGDTAFRFENQDILWLDNSPSNGGKPWMSPFSAGTKSYLSRITAEISQAGFDEIICTDISFPYFRNSDLSYIGSIVKSETRYLALVEVANQIISTAQQNNSNIIIEESAVKIINGTSEIYKPDEIDNAVFIAKISLDEAGDTITSTSGEISLTEVGNTDKVKIIIQELEKVFGKSKVVPSLLSDEYTEDEFNQLLSELSDSGYNSYIIR